MKAPAQQKIKTTRQRKIKRNQKGQHISIKRFSIVYLIQEHTKIYESKPPNSIKYKNK